MVRRIGPGPERSESRAFSFSGMQKHNCFVNMLSPASRWFLMQFNNQFIQQNCRFEDRFQSQITHKNCLIKKKTLCSVSLFTVWLRSLLYCCLSQKRNLSGKAENQPIISPDKTAVTFYYYPICRIPHSVFMELQEKQPEKIFSSLNVPPDASDYY